MNTFSVGQSLRFGWETFKKRPWFLVGITLCGLILIWVAGAIQQDSDIQWIAALVLFLVSLALSTLIDMGLTAVTLHAHDDVAHVSFHDLWHPKSFLNYLGMSILVGIITFIGFILLIVPGVILALMYAFTKFLVIERDLHPITAMKESARITKGSRLTLLLLALAIIGLNALGLIALFVGLLVTLPVSMLAWAHAYRTLAHTGSSEQPHTTPLPHAPHTSSI